MVTLEDLPEHFQNSSNLQSSFSEPYTLQKGMALSDALKDFENKLIVNALEESGGVKAKAARILNIKRTTLVEKIKKNKTIISKS